MLTLQALRYIEETIEPTCYLELCHRNPDILERVLNWIVLSKPAAGKCAPMQVIKQSESGELQQFRNKNDPHFRRTMVNS